MNLTIEPQESFILARIEDARLDGASVVTTERISYAEQYTFDQVGGDPQAPVTVSYRRSGSGWHATVG